MKQLHKAITLGCPRMDKVITRTCPRLLRCPRWNVIGKHLIIRNTLQKEVILRNTLDRRRAKPTTGSGSIVNLVIRAVFVAEPLTSIASHGQLMTRCITIPKYSATTSLLGASGARETGRSRKTNCGVLSCSKVQGSDSVVQTAQWLGTQWLAHVLNVFPRSVSYFGRPWLRDSAGCGCGEADRQECAYATRGCGCGEACCIVVQVVLVIGNVQHHQASIIKH